MQHHAYVNRKFTDIVDVLEASGDEVVVAATSAAAIELTQRCTPAAPTRRGALRSVPS